MTEQGNNTYKVTLTDTRFDIDRVNPADGGLIYVSGAARPAAKDGEAYTTEEENGFSNLIVLALGLALAQTPAEVSVAIEGSGEDLARIGRILQTKVGQLVAA